MEWISGNPVSAGIAYGKLYHYAPYICTVQEDLTTAGEEQHQLARYQNARQTCVLRLRKLSERMAAHDKEKAKIFEAHREILEDEEILKEIQDCILQEHRMADWAVFHVYSQYAEMLSALEDPLLAARSADLTDVSQRLIRILRDAPEKDLSELPEEVIVVAHDLLPSDTATIDKERVLAIITETGGTTSHSAIIARSYHIPAVLGVADAATRLPEGQMCLVDAIDGKVCMQPDAQTVAHYQSRKAAFASAQERNLTFQTKPALLKTGERIQIGLNVDPTENSQSYKACDYVGLLRTEFLYMHSSHLPTEEEQYSAYQQIIKQAAGKSVILRTLDIGGDKSLSYMELPKEQNPFLGKRAIRLCLDLPELFQTQLRAALRAAAEGTLQIMFPMIGSIEEFRLAKAAVQSAAESLRQDGVPFCKTVALGVMIEIPSVAMIADKIAAEVDFASVGTNDLVQYLHAADRINPETSQYYQSYSPAVFRTLERIFSAFRAAGKPISVCGELGGDPLAAPVLVGLGLRKFSMSASRIGQMKHSFSVLSMEACCEMAQRVTAMATQQEVIDYLRQTL